MLRCTISATKKGIVLKEVDGEVVNDNTVEEPASIKPADIK